MIRLGLIGFPLVHSLSPVLHQAALRAAGLEGSYSLYAVESHNTDRLRELIDCVRTRDLTGLNVTIPHKRSLLPLLDALTSSARMICAVNTIYSLNGRVIGDNTDAPGFARDLDRFEATPASALVLGAGGAARAVAYALCNRACAVSVAARDIRQAQQLAGEFAGVTPLHLDADSLAGVHADLVVNATPVGMFPNLGETVWPADLPFPAGAMIYDLVYNPMETQLVRSARAAGLRAVTGLGMLIEQAALSFELWTGTHVQRDVLMDALAPSLY